MSKVYDWFEEDTRFIDEKSKPLINLDEKKGLPLINLDEKKGLPLTNLDEKKGLPLTNLDEKKGLPLTNLDEKKGLPLTNLDEKKGLALINEDMLPNEALFGIQKTLSELSVTEKNRLYCSLVTNFLMVLMIGISVLQVVLFVESFVLVGPKPVIGWLHKTFIVVATKVIEYMALFGVFSLL